MQAAATASSAPYGPGELAALHETTLALAEHPMAATFGVASFPDDGSTAAELLRAADRALYLAKQAGGNRTLTLSDAA